MPLTSPACKNAKPKEKPYKLFDGGGLFLLVHSNGGKYWRLKYRVGGKEKMMALGTHRVVTLKSAREKLMDAKRQLDNEIDPSAAKQQKKRQARREVTA